MILNKNKKNFFIILLLSILLIFANASTSLANESKDKSIYFNFNKKNTTGSAISMNFEESNSNAYFHNTTYRCIPYYVQPGDSILSISNLFNTNTESLEELNCISFGTIFLGQPLLTVFPVIPVSAELNNSWAFHPNLVLVNKIYTLDGSYEPKELVVPNVAFPFKEFHTKKLLDKEAATALENLFQAAKMDGHHLFALSGYRSYATQKKIFTRNVFIKGYEEANKFSAVPGQSEHQTGLAMDITSKSVNYQLIQAFGDTPEGKWVADHAHEYGFIIRYLKDKEDITGYEYEPWHLRYVGVDFATEIEDLGITLEEYLIYPLKDSKPIILLKK